MASRVLYTATAVRAAITDLIRHADRERVAIVAYVGEGADAYLPSPKGLRLLCSPTPGGTNPDTLRSLIERGVDVRFVDGLHAKVYWTKGVGCVVTSANLSTNALGIGGLKEAGVLLGPRDVSIQSFLRGLSSRPALPELHRLDRAHKEYYKRNGWHGARRAARSFVEWATSPAPEEWKLCFYWSISDKLSNYARSVVREEYNRSPTDWIWSQKPTVRENDWVLCAYVKRDRVQFLEWLFTDRIVKVPKRDRRFDASFPYEVIQAYPLKHYPIPPFSLSAQLRGALSSTCKDLFSKETDSPFTLANRYVRQLHSILA